MILTHEIFFNSFQYNFFEYKQSSIEYLMERSSEELKEIAGGTANYSEEDFKRGLKMDARLTYLLAVDTLFELVFALLPSKKLEIMDEKIIDQLNRNNKYFPELVKLLSDKPNDFKKLKYTINYNDGYSCDVLRYIFYDGLFNTEFEKDISTSMIVMHEAILFFAKEALDNRAEINSYKHGLRLLPTFGSLIISNSSDKGKNVEFDLKNSIAFQTKNKNTKTIHSIPLDYKKDVQLTYFISQMLHNLFQTRRRKYRKAENNEGTFFVAFTENSLSDARKANLSAGIFKLNFPIGKENS